MKRLLAFLLVMFALTACRRDVSPTNPDADEPAVTYLTDDGSDADVDTAHVDTADASARITAGSSGKLTFEYLNNETEIFRPLQYSVRLWAADEIADPSRSYLDALGDGKYDRPTYTVVKNTPKAYTRKTVKAGWYIAEFDGSGQFFKFNLAAGSDGLLIYNQHDFNGRFRGYFSNYGKIKVGWAKAPAHDANTVLEFQDRAGVMTSIWIYAEDGTTSARSQYWFMPAGTYQMVYNLHPGDDRYDEHRISVNVVPGKTYPYVRMTL